MTPAEQQQLIEKLEASFAPTSNPEIKRQLRAACLTEKDLDAIIKASSGNRVKLEASTMIPVLEELLEEEDKPRVIGKLQTLSDETKGELLKLLALRAMMLLSERQDSAI